MQQSVSVSWITHFAVNIWVLFNVVAKQFLLAFWCLAELQSTQCDHWKLVFVLHLAIL
jgi:hypothetical protein